MSGEGEVCPDTSKDKVSPFRPPDLQTKPIKALQNKDVKIIVAATDTYVS